jgi:sulfur-oxidizing protein SoxX
MRLAATATVLLLTSTAALPASAVPGYVAWQADNYAIAEPLAGLSGDPGRGREVVRRKDRGNCLACHSLPIPEESFHGTVGPPLAHVASRLNAGQLRLRIADETRLVPGTIMPAFHKNPAELHRVADEFFGKPILSAQEVEDVVAYLMTLK